MTAVDRRMADFARYSEVARVQAPPGNDAGADTIAKVYQDKIRGITTLTKELLGNGFGVCIIDNERWKTETRLQQLPDLEVADRRKVRNTNDDARLRVDETGRGEANPDNLDAPVTVQQFLHGLQHSLELRLDRALGIDGPLCMIENATTQVHERTTEVRPWARDVPNVAVPRGQEMPERAK